MIALDATDRAIVNALQGGFPLCERPFAAAAEPLGLDEDELIARIATLRDSGAISRFGPLWNADALGGSACLAAMAVPPERFEPVAAQVNAHSEVAQNYEREHALNMWFVISSLDPARIADVAREIEAETGIAVVLMPKEREYFVGFRVEA